MAEYQQAAARNSAQAARVEQVSRRLLAANPQIKMNPVLSVPGTQQPEIFHHGERRLVISESLVSQCKTEGQLAAVLSLELAKCVAERQSRADALALAGDREPPPEVRIGPDGGSYGDADQTRKAELVQHGLDRRKPQKTANPVDPLLLARQFLVKAGYAETDLEDAAPLLQAVGSAPAASK
jgi:hypothetical protein